MSAISSKQPYRFVVLALACALAFMGNYLQYQVTGLAVEVMSIMHIDTAGFQLLFLMPMLAAVFFSVPLGALGDRFGPKRVVAVCYAIALLGSLLRVVSLSSFALQLACVFLIGIGMTALTANNAKTLGLWFGSKTDFAMGFYYAFSCLGISASQATAGLAGSISASYMVSSGALAIVLILWAVFDKNMPNGASVPRDLGNTPSLAKAARSRNVWLIAFCAGITLTATTGYAGLLPQALELERGMDTVAAGQMSSLLTIASMVGCLVTPLLCSKFKSMRAYLAAMGVVGAFVMLTTWLVPGNGTLLLAALMINGFVTSMMGPILQSLPVLLPEIGTRFAGSAGGIIAEVSLMLSFALPVAFSAVAGSDYLLNFTLLGACYSLSLAFVSLLPKFTAKGIEGDSQKAG